MVLNVSVSIFLRHTHAFYGDATQEMSSILSMMTMNVTLVLSILIALADLDNNYLSVMLALMFSSLCRDVVSGSPLELSPCCWDQDTGRRRRDDYDEQRRRRTWGPRPTQQAPPPGRFRRTASAPDLSHSWTCSGCRFLNVSVSARCAACGRIDDDAQPVSVSNVPSDAAAMADQVLAPVEVTTTATTVDVIDENDGSVGGDRRRSKVSRSLSNGAFRPRRRPTSLGLGGDHRWICQRCTLDNAAGAATCEACETPRGGGGTGRNGVTITVPDWRDAKPAYRRSFSEAQPSQAPPPVTRFSYIGLSEPPLQRMWTCTKCSYTYNPLWSDSCDICESARSPPSLTEPSLITCVGVRWTCRKCTLVNAGADAACVVCGGSRLRSLAPEDATLRKGEFWACAQCTLKNPLGAAHCLVCRTAKKLPHHAGAVPKQRAAQPTPRRSRGYLAAPSTSTIAPSSPAPSSWQCVLCTYENRTDAVTCEICQSSRCLSANAVLPRAASPSPSPSAKQPPPVVPPTSRPGIVKQESELMEELRRLEEMDALQQWERIVHYCRDVSAPPLF